MQKFIIVLFIVFGHLLNGSELNLLFDDDSTKAESFIRIVPLPKKKDLETALVTSDFEALQELFTVNPSLVNKGTIEYGWPITFAIGQNNIKLVEFLLHFGADPNIDKFPLKLVRSYDIAILLLINGAKPSIAISQYLRNRIDDLVEFGNRYQKAVKEKNIEQFLIRSRWIEIRELMSLKEIEKLQQKYPDKKIPQDYITFIKQQIKQVIKTLEIWLQYGQGYIEYLQDIHLKNHINSIEQINTFSNLPKVMKNYVSSYLIEKVLTVPEGAMAFDEFAREKGWVNIEEQELKEIQEIPDNDSKWCCIIS